MTPVFLEMFSQHVLTPGVFHQTCQAVGRCELDGQQLDLRQLVPKTFPSVLTKQCVVSEMVDRWRHL